MDRLSAYARQVLKEPLFHFLIAGLMIFLLFSGGSADPESRKIIVNEAQVARLAAQWQQTWQRPPNLAELDGLIRDHIREEVYYREALRLGLDRDDAIIRKRLRAKMEFLGTSAVELATPDDAVLQDWLDQNGARYAKDAVISFDQIYLRSAGAAPTILARLKAGARWERLGDAISLPKAMEETQRSEIERQFGMQFASALGAQPVSVWSGPVESGFGTHLVRVRAVKATQTPALSEVRQRVENDWRSATKNDRETRAYQALLDGYDIRIEKPE